VAALSGIMVVISLRTVEWKESREIIQEALRKPNTQHILDLAALLVSAVVCYRVDMGLGVGVGVMISQLKNILGLFSGSKNKNKQL